MEYLKSHYPSRQLQHVFTDYFRFPSAYMHRAYAALASFIITLCNAGRFICSDSSGPQPSLSTSESKSCSSSQTSTLSSAPHTVPTTIFIPNMKESALQVVDHLVNKPRGFSSIWVPASEYPLWSVTETLMNEGDDCFGGYSHKTEVRIYLYNFQS